MRYQKQKNHHQPEFGIYGDCHRTCLAVLLDRDRDSVPHYFETIGRDVDGDAFNRFYRDWLRSQGYSEVLIYFAPPLADVFATIKHHNPGVYYILSGESRSGVNHSVVALEDRIVCDPSLTDAGIVGPLHNGHFAVTFLIPLNQTVQGSEPNVQA